MSLTTSCYEWNCRRSSSSSSSSSQGLASGPRHYTDCVSYDYRDTLSFIRLFAYSLSSLQEKEVHSFTDFLLTTDEDMLAMVLRAALRDGVIMIGASEDDERKIGRRVNDGDVTSMIVLRSWMGHLC